ncbi:MAG: MFS transporter [Bacteroidetes bacterium]|nr:MFS transporter [Bacteroidota bacterium]MBU1580094.1 MFS transporter [Bacteroidota bacterium]MBU2465016.1 MFS transporter [Bacteroidota bacterium]MBU2556654.1 MFS transporter [Bacteroidota bacterium]
MRWTKKQLSIVAIVAVTSFMGTFLISSVNIALPAIEKSFGLSAVALSWVLTSFLLANAMFLLPVGRWGDITGIRRMFKIGVVIFSLVSLACGLVSSGFWLIFFRFVQGIGAALTSTTGPAILVSAFGPKNRGRVIGIAVSGVYLGLATGPFLGGMLTEFAGWRFIFFVSSALGMLTAIVALLFLGKDEQKPEFSKQIDLKGTAFYMAGLLALVYGSVLIPEVYGWMMLAVGILFLIIFWKMETRSSFPVINTRLFTQNRLFAYSNLASLINYSATFAIVFLLSLYLQKILKLSPREAGTILVAQPVMMALFSPLAGRLSDKIQPRFLTTLGMSMCTIGLLAFAFLTNTSPLWLIVVELIWVGIGFALFSSPNMNTIMSAVDRNNYGIASGTAATGRVLGQIISMTIVALFLSGFIGHEAIEAVDDHLFMQVVKYGFICFSGISLIGIYFSYQRGIVRRAA